MSTVVQTVVDKEMMYEFVDEADETDDVKMVDIDVFDSDQIVATEPSDRKICHKCLKVQTKRCRAFGLEQVTFLLIIAQNSHSTVRE
jgi:hypothetical protein